MNKILTDFTSQMQAFKRRNQNV